MKLLLICCVTIGLLPTFAAAQIVINEVMYNPQGSDSGREWIELYNQGAFDVTMTGGSGKSSWRISDSSNHTLTDPAGAAGSGSLTVPAGGYLVIANDPNDFISGEYAGGSCSVVKSSISLNNNGSTLTLLDGSGGIVDTVSYTPSQGGNDDSSSLQRQSDGMWIAALPTPCTANSTVPYAAPVQSDTSSKQQPNQQPASSTDQTTGQPQTPPVVDSYVAAPAPKLYADAGSDRIVIVGADVEFDANAYDKTQALLDPSKVRFMWNFGDGSSPEGSSVLHHFAYPGRYAVVLTIASDKNAAEAQIVVTAQPAALSLALLPDGGIEIQDLAGRDLDLSDWIVREDQGPFAGQFMLPVDSKLLSGSSMNIPPQTLSFRASSSTILEYPNGTVSLAIGQSTGTTDSTSSTSSTSSRQTSSSQAGSRQASSAQAAEPTVASVVDETMAVSKIPTANVPAPAISVDGNVDTQTGDEGTYIDTSDTTTMPTSTVLEATPMASGNASYLWWVGVITLVLAVASALVAAMHFKKHEWDIVDDKSE